MTKRILVILLPVILSSIFYSVEIARAAPPVNDDPANAVIVSSLPYSQTITNQNEATSVGDPNPSCEFGNFGISNTVWYRFAVLNAGTVSIDTLGSTPATAGNGGDTVLVVYSGTPSTASEVACSDDIGSNANSQVGFAVTAGTTYFVMVANFSSTPMTAPGTLNVNFSGTAVFGTVPANDNIANATVLTDLPASFTANNQYLATVESGDPNPSCEFSNLGVSNTVWYRFTVVTAGTVSINTSGSTPTGAGNGGDTVLVVYSGTPSTGSEVACNDDAGSNFYSQISNLVVTAGTTYNVMVANFTSPPMPAPGTLNVNFSGTAVLSLPVVTVSALDSSADETSGDNGILRFSRTGSTAADLTISYSTSGTASGGDFYLSYDAVNPLSGSVIIFAGQSFIDVYVTPVDDIPAEPAESVVVQLSTSVNYTLGVPNNATVTIIANDFVVTNNGDSGEGTLRQALVNANDIAGIQTVTFEAAFRATSPTIVLTSGELTIDTILSVDGTGGGMVTVRSGGSFRVLRVIAGNPVQPVELKGFTVSSGSMDKGGGIAVLGGWANLAPMTITSNSASTCGGGLYVNNATVVVESGSQITNNTTTGDGGGICVEDGVLTLQGASQVNSNTATGNGGGIYERQVVGSSSVTVTGGSQISSNQAAVGGGIYQATGSLSVTTSVLNRNVSTTSGAIRFNGVSSGSVTNSCLTGNRDTAVTTPLTGSVNATGNWWGSVTGPYSGQTTPNPPNDANTAVSNGDSVTYSTDPTVFNYAGYLTTPPSGIASSCLTCAAASSMGGARVCKVP